MIPNRFNTKVVVFALILLIIGLIRLFIYEQNVPDGGIKDTELKAIDEQLKESVRTSEREVDMYEITERTKSIDELRLQENADILFYGRVIDQESGEGLQGCVVYFEFSGYKGIPLPGSSTTFEKSDSVSTDGNGHFFIDGISGRSLRILKIVKPKYVLQQGGDFSFTYGKKFGGRHDPKEAEPVLYGMVKESSDLVLIPVSLRRDFRAGENYAELTIPVRSSSYNDRLRLNISFKRNLDETEQNYEWGYSISFTEELIAESNDSSLLLAPKDGYRESFEQSYGPFSDRWAMRSQKHFYLRSIDSSMHAGLGVTVFSYKDGRFRLILSGSVNPNGALVVGN